MAELNLKRMFDLLLYPPQASGTNQTQASCTGPELLMAGSLRLYRRWMLKGENTISPYVHGQWGHTWHSTTMEAKCDRQDITMGLDGQMKHDAAIAVPALGCKCGIYGYHTEERIQDLPVFGLWVYGTVRGSGKMLVGDKGARVAKAEIESLCAPQGDYGFAVRSLFPGIPVYESKDVWLRDFPPEDISALLGPVVD